MILPDMPSIKQLIDITNNFVMINKAFPDTINDFDIEDSDTLSKYYKENSVIGTIGYGYTFDKIDFSELTFAVLINDKADWFDLAVQDDLQENNKHYDVYVTKMTVNVPFYYIIYPYHYELTYDRISKQVMEHTRINDRATKIDEISVVYEYDNNTDESDEDMPPDLILYSIDVEADYHIARVTALSFPEAIFKNLTSV